MKSTAPSYNTFRDPNALLQEADRLKRICKRIKQADWGGRMHYPLVRTTNNYARLVRCWNEL